MKWLSLRGARDLQVDKLRHTTEDTRAKLQEKENIIKDLSKDRQASLQERCAASRGQVAPAPFTLQLLMWSP